MTKRKSTKRTLLLSTLALLLCVSMLIGSTFAWFTDSVTSDNNKIVAGNIDMELEYSKDMADWEAVSEATELFSDELWEPGHTEVVYLKLKNLGDLAIKYQLGINIASETGSTNVLGNDFKLSDYIYFDVIEGVSAPYAGRVAAVAAADDAVIISTGYSKSGTMIAQNEELYMAVVVYMPEIIGNEANYKTGTAAPEIKLGVNVSATQFTKESDSFGSDYDALAGETHFMVNGVNYNTFDEAVENAAPDADGVVTYFIGGEAVFSGGWNAPIAPEGTNKVVIKGTGTKTATLNLAHTYRNQLCATGMIVEISDITIDCDPCGTHQDQRNIWVHADELYATNVVFKDPADASAVKVAVFDGCTFACTGTEDNNDNNYQLWVGDHDANYGSVIESVTVKNSVFETGRRAIKLAPSTGSTSYNALIDNNTFYDITYKPAVCLNYGTQANTVTITNNTLYNTALVEDEVDGNYTESNNILVESVKVTTETELRDIAETSKEDVVVTLGGDLTLGNETETCMAINFANAKNVTIIGNGRTLTLKGKAPYNDNPNTHLSGILANNATVTIKNLTIVNEKLSKNGTEIAADRAAVYTMVRAEKVVYENVDFIGGVQVRDNAEFVDCTFEENVLVANDEGYATNGRFCMFIDHQYDATGTWTIDLEGCSFNASGYGCVKVAGDKGADITVNVKDCSFTNTCPSNSWSQTTPKYDVKMTGSNITVNDLGGNDWSDGANAGYGNG